MGYNTRFTARVEGEGLVLEKFYEDQEASEDWYDGDYGVGLKFWSDSDSYDSMKWYGWEEDCKKLSLAYPNLLFILEGEGEENDDMWKAWFRNGKSVVVRAVVTFPTPDLDNVIPFDYRLEQKVIDAENESRKQALLAELEKIQSELSRLGVDN